MAFTDLNSELQNILLVNHSYLTKWFVILFLLFISVYYLFFEFKENQPTKFIFVMVYRFIFFAISLVYLITFPLTIVNLSPEYAFFNFFNLYLSIYQYSLALIFILFFIDLIRYSPLVLLRLAAPGLLEKLGLKNENVKEIADRIENNRNFIKMSKNGR